MPVALGPRRSRRVSLLALAGLGLALAVPLAGPVAADTTYAEQVGHYGVNTFQNYHNASGVGQHIDAFTTVQVSCKVLDTFIQSANPDGYWYRIASSPWNNEYYSPANTFYNGDPIGGPYTHNTDFAVPDCGSAPAPQPAPPSPQPAPAASATLAQGPAAPVGYRYAISLNNFPANSQVGVSCRDNASPGGFYSFSLGTDGAGNASTAAYCYTADGPDHWFVANGVESNHVSWGAAPGGSASPPKSQPVAAPAPVGTGLGRHRGRPVGYYALGDSYSSGEGNPRFIANAGACDRTDAAWPYRAGHQARSVWWLGSSACSGAVAADIPIQLLGLSKVSPNVGLVTVTIGGNDAEFAGVLKVCYTEHLPKRNCVSDGTLARASVRIAGLQPALTKAYGLIKFVAPSARLVVVGYPRLFPNDQSKTTGCGWLSDDMRKVLINIGDQLNRVIQAAAKDAGADFVSVNDALDGHELCTAKTWMNPIEPNPYDRRAAHPTGPGQQAMANVVANYFTGQGQG